MQMRQLCVLTGSNLRLLLRDRVIYAVAGVAGAMLLMIPMLSSFSMRQVQELAITLSLSAISFTLLVLALLLGAHSIWRDVDRRFTLSILSLPIGRTSFVMAKFLSTAIFLFLSGTLLGMLSCLIIALASLQYPSDLPIAWSTIWLAIFADIAKYVLLAAFALLLSTVSTSFYLPFFGTLAIYLAGSASQEVYEYVSGAFGEKIPQGLALVVKGTYYLLPNLSAFDWKVHAVYALPVDHLAVLLLLGYLLTYGGIVLCLAVWAFSRREFP